MTEAKKKQLALEIFQRENDRLKSRPLYGVDTAAFHRMEKQQAVFKALSQQGISWQDLKKAYDDAFTCGQKEMLYFRMTFFYAATTIAYKEQFPEAVPETVADFMRRLAGAPEEADDHATLSRLCLETTGFDATPYDKPGTASPASRGSVGTRQHVTRKDRTAIARMQKTGITEADLAYERDVGYSNGWNSPFHYSACVAGLALILHRLHGFGADAIESFVERVQEITDEEISVADILSRCEKETGTDVSRMA